MVHGGAEVEGKFAVRGKGSAVGRAIEGDHFSSRRVEIKAVGVECPVNLFMSGAFRDSGLAHQVQCKEALREEVFYAGHGEGRVTGGKAGDEVVFEGLDRALGIVGSMVAGRC